MEEFVNSNVPPGTLPNRGQHRGPRIGREQAATHKISKDDKAKLRSGQVVRQRGTVPSRISHSGSGRQSPAESHDSTEMDTSRLERIMENGRDSHRQYSNSHPYYQQNHYQPGSDDETQILRDLDVMEGHSRMPLGEGRTFLEPADPEDEIAYGDEEEDNAEDATDLEAENEHTISIDQASPLFNRSHPEEKPLHQPQFTRELAPRTKNIPQTGARGMNQHQGHRSYASPRKASQLPQQGQRSDGEERRDFILPGPEPGLSRSTEHVQTINPEDQIDYSVEDLAKIPYSELANQDFDVNPKANKGLESVSQGNLKERLERGRTLPSDQQRQFFDGLKLDEWDEAGDWFLEQFSEMMSKMREARRAKRELAQKFERQVSQRQEIVEERKRSIDHVLTDMKKNGQGVLLAQSNPNET